MNDSTGSARPIGLFTAICLVIANMIGAGIFTTSGLSLGALQDRNVVMLAWAVGGLIAICGAYSYGQLAKHISESGGEYLFLSRVIHPSIGFVAGWVSLLAGFTGAIAFAATVFEAYAFPESIHPGWYMPGTVAIISIIVFGLLHATLLRSGLVTQNVVVVIKLILIAVFICYSFVILPSGRWVGFSSSMEAESFSIYGFAAALVWISLSFSGFNAAVYVTGEVKRPGQNVPRALLIGTSIVVAIYLALNAIFLFAATPESISGQQEVAAIAGKALGGTILENLVRLTIAFAMLSSVSSMIIAGPRVYQKMASDKLFPKLFGGQGVEGDKPPVASIWLQVILASIVVYFSTLENLLSYLGFTLSVSAALTVACLFVIQRREPLNLKSVLVQLVAGIYVAATLVIAALSLNVQGKPQMFGVFCLTVFTGLILYFGMVSFRRPKRNFEKQ